MDHRCGFIGLGIMGTGMSRNLLAAGHSLTVYNRTASKCEPLAEAGAAVAASPAELAAECAVVICCVSDTDDVEDVLFGPAGVVGGARPGTLVIDCSTISPAATRDVATRLSERDIAFVDAPVSGGSEGAAQGTLSIMAGGSDADLATAAPYLDAMGAKLTHVGPVGAGQTCKLVNQVLVGVGMLAISEAFLLAEAGGLDLARVLQAVESGAAGSWALTNRGPQILDRDWRPGFSIDLQQKDLRLVLETAADLGVPALATSQVSALYTALQHAGRGGDGNHALIGALEALSGVTVGSTQDGADGDR